MIVNPAFGGLSIIIYTALAFILVGIVQILFCFYDQKTEKDKYSF